MVQKQNEMEQVVNEIKGYYQSWLVASNLTEDEFLGFRTCNHFRIQIEECVDCFAVQMCYGKTENPIGLPFYVGIQNSLSEKKQYFENTPLILMYMAGRLDKENTQNPINGSYGSDYFKEKTKKACVRILEKRQKWCV